MASYFFRYVWWVSMIVLIGGCGSSGSDGPSDRPAGDVEEGIDSAGRSAEDDGQTLEMEPADVVEEMSVGDDQDDATNDDEPLFEDGNQPADDASPTEEFEDGNGDSLASGEDTVGDGEPGNMADEESPISECGAIEIEVGEPVADSPRGRFGRSPAVGTYRVAALDAVVNPFDDTEEVTLSGSYLGEHEICKPLGPDFSDNCPGPACALSIGTDGNGTGTGWGFGLTPRAFTWYVEVDEFCTPVWRELEDHEWEHRYARLFIETSVNMNLDGDGPKDWMLATGDANFGANTGPRLVVHSERPVAIGFGTRCYYNREP